jgi:hypothetical protein
MAAPLLNRCAMSPRSKANYDVSTERQRFSCSSPLMLRRAPQINIVLNWFEELKQRVPKDRNSTAWMHGFD